MENYTHGGDRYGREIELDYSVNINPLGMPKESLQAAKEGVLLSDRYPDPLCRDLIREIRFFEGVTDQTEILTGNGAAELIYALCSAIPEGKALLLAPSFQEYENALVAAGHSGDFIYLKEAENFALPIQELLSRITKEISLVFLCNPCNPTGTVTGKEELVKLAEKCEETGTFLCVDECFLPFLSEEPVLTMKKETERFSHLIVLRAFTKVYGMPGLRLGYLLTGNRRLAERLKEKLPPWNVSLPAQLAGIAALRAEGYLEKTRELIRGEKEKLVSVLLETVADRVYPGSANFLLFRGREGLKEELLARKILIRDCSNFRGLTKGYYRICVRTQEENERLKEALYSLTGKETGK